MAAMRRLARWSLNAVAVLSLLLCAATVALWARSYYRTDTVIHHRSAPAPEFAAEACYDCAITSCVGGLQFDRTTSYYGPGTSAYGPHTVIRSVDSGLDPPFFGTFDRHHRTFWQRAGFEACNETTNATPPFTTQGVIVPHWFFAMFVGLPGISAVLRAAARGRSRTGRCAGCGYDLTGNVSGVCPECGTDVAAQPAA